ncbi:MAG TPA: MFS transporter [Thermoplasmata archaeon]|nr:MFS transporter [Thermoplasmata archaeon]
MSAPAPAAAAAASNDHFATTAAGTPYDARAANAVLIVVALMALMVTYVETMVIPSFGAFETFFNYPPATTVVWIISAYLLVGTVATPIFGKLGDKYGKKRMMLIVMSLYAVAVSLAGFSPNIGQAFGLDRANQIYVLIGIRAFQGLGMGMFPLAFAMLPEVFPAARVGTAQGIVSGMFAAGAAVGLVGGGYIAYEFGWQLTYHTVIPVAVVLVILAYFILRESPYLHPAAIDVPGIASLGIALATALFGITEGAYWGWGSVAAVHWGGVPVGVVQFFVLALVATAFFVWWELRTPNPVVSFSALKQRNIWVSNVNGVFVGVGMFLVFVGLVILIEYNYPPGFGYNDFDMGLSALPAALGMLAFAPLWGRWIGKAGPKPVTLAGFAIMGLGALGLVIFHANVYEVSLFTIPALVGNVAILIAMSNIIVLSVGRHELGIQTGMNQTFRNLGSAVGPVLAATILASFLTPYVITLPPPAPPVTVQIYSNFGFQLVFAVIAILSLVGFGLSLLLRNYRFLADGSRSDAAAAAPDAGAARSEEPALAAGSAR